jgi:hypothetical protein
MEYLASAQAVAQPHIDAARSTLQPHVDKARETAKGYLGMHSGTSPSDAVAPRASGRSTTNAPLSGQEIKGTPYASTTTTAGADQKKLESAGQSLKHLHEVVHPTKECDRTICLVKVEIFLPSCVRKKKRRRRTEQHTTYNPILATTYLSAIKFARR